MRGQSLPVLVLATVLTVWPAQARGQDPDLMRIDSMIAAGELDKARESLETWRDANPPGAAGPGRGSQAHALFLRGRLATDWVGAEDAYLSVVLGYPTSQQAPESLLLLGKGLLAAASTRIPSTAAIRAVSYLERLSNDYPGNPLHDEAQIWLARAHEGAGHPEKGCAVLRQTLSRAVDPGIGRAATAELESMCPSSPTQLATIPPRPDSAAPERNVAARAAPERQDTTPTAARAPEAPDRRPFTVQVAAMSSREGADRLSRQLTNAGFETRVVDLDGSRLVRVRVGTFATEAEATAMADRIRQRGFEAIVTNDVQRESRGP